jgi:excisionase family DNA binding protein
LQEQGIIMKNGSVEKTFCTTREAASLLGVSVGTIQLWVENGLLQAWKTSGGHRRVLRESIDRLIRSAPPAQAQASAAAAEASPPVPAPGPVVQAKPLILVVEDDRFLLKLYEVHISKWKIGADYICVDNAMAGLIAIGRKKPDVLITDLQMPHMNGIEMIRVLNMHPDTGKMKIIAITGMDAHAIQAEGGLPPQVEIFQKPIPFDRLKNTVAQFLSPPTTLTA